MRPLAMRARRRRGWQVKTYFTYMLFCFDGSYYVGVTSNLERRLWEHQNAVNEACYTATRRPVLLVWSQDFQNVLDAIASEKKIKGWSHAKKSALARGDWRMISALSKGRHRSKPDLPLSS